MALSDEDKHWFRETFATKDGIQQLESKLETFATKEDLERIETKLLTAFHDWASPMEARQRTHTAALRAIDAEMEYLSDRVKKLEDESKAS